MSQIRKNVRRSVMSVPSYGPSRKALLQLPWGLKEEHLEMRWGVRTYRRYIRKHFGVRMEKMPSVYIETLTDEKDKKLVKKYLEIRKTGVWKKLFSKAEMDSD